MMSLIGPGTLLASEKGKYFKIFEKVFFVEIITDCAKYQNHVLQFICTVWIVSHV